MKTSPVERGDQQLHAGNGYYIVDFYLPRPLKLVIEVDGSSHDNRQEYDKRKDAYLVRRGFTVLRVTNEQILSNPSELPFNIFS